MRDDIKDNAYIKNINYILGRQRRTEAELDRKVGWRALASEIIYQAIKDYKDKWTSTRELYRIRKFFNGKWFKVLSDLDPKYILRKLDEYRSEHGYIVIDDTGRRCTDSDNADSISTVGTSGSQKG